MKNVLSTTIALATLLAPLAANAFEPIAYRDVPSLIGKPVFASTNRELPDDAWIYAGEPLTLVSAKVFDKQGTTETYNYVRVKTKAGVEGEIQLRFLSRAPLKYNLREPGKAKDLVLAVLDDAFDLPARMHTTRTKYNYASDLNGQVDEAHQVDSMEEAFKNERTLLHNFVYSSNRSKEDLMREGATKWLATASDSKLLDWYADGIKETATKDKLVNADRALSTLDNVSSMAYDVARLQKEKADKPWREGMTGIPADKLAKLDAEKTSAIDKEIATKQKQIKESFSEAAAEKAKAR